MPNVALSENKIPKLLLALVLIIALITILIFSLNYFFLGKALTLKENMNILIIGMDSGTNAASVKTVPETDTLILSLINPKSSKVALLYVPSNCITDIPNHSPVRISEANAIGGFTLTKVLVSEITGAKINRYIVIDFEGFKHLVDLVGGVEVNVAKAMRFVDEYGLYTFSLSPGKQTLNGDKALKYLRYRDESLGEMGRITRQEEVLYAALKKLKQKANLFMIPELLKAKGKYVKTDLSSWDLLKLIKFGRVINQEKDIANHLLPVTSYKKDYLPEPVQIKQLLDKINEVGF